MQLKLIYDLTGRKVKTLVADQNTMSGRHEFDLSVSEFNPGVYLCIAETQELK